MMRAVKRTGSSQPPDPGTYDMNVRGPVSFPDLATARQYLDTPADANYVMWNSSWPTNYNLADALLSLTNNDILVLPERPEPYLIDSTDGFSAVSVKSIDGYKMNPDGTATVTQLPIVNKQVDKWWFTMAQAKRGIIGLGPGAVIQIGPSAFSQQRQIPEKGRKLYDAAGNWIKMVDANGQPYKNSDGTVITNSAGETHLSPGRFYVNIGSGGALNTAGPLNGAQEKLIHTYVTNADTYYGNFSLRGRDLGGVAYNVFQSIPGAGTTATFEHLDLSNGWRGFSGTPNGETGAIGIGGAGQYMIRRCLLGTRDSNGVRVGTSPIMISNSSGGSIIDTDCVEAYAGMLTIWNSSGKHTLTNVNSRWSEGFGINIEQVRKGFSLEWNGGSIWSDYKGQGGKLPRPADQSGDGNLHVGLSHSSESTNDPVQNGSVKLSFTNIDIDNNYLAPGKLSIQEYTSVRKQKVSDITFTKTDGTVGQVQLYQ